MSRASGTLTGAGSGAAAGAALGPWGAAAGGVIGGLVGYFGSGDDDDVQKAQEAKLAAGRAAANEYMAFRDVSNEAHMRAMANQQSYFDQNSSILNSMNGGQGAPDIAGGSYQSVIHGDGMKPVNIANTTPQYGNAPMPEQNAPRPLTYAPGGR